MPPILLAEQLTQKAVADTLWKTVANVPLVAA